MICAVDHLEVLIRLWGLSRLAGRTRGGSGSYLVGVGLLTLVHCFQHFARAHMCPVANCHYVRQAVWPDFQDFPRNYPLQCMWILQCNLISNFQWLQECFVCIIVISCLNECTVFVSLGCCQVIKCVVALLSKQSCKLFSSKQ